MDGPRVYIIIVNYLRWQDSAECIVSVLKSSYRNFTILLIDNDSGNNSVEQIISSLTIYGESILYHTGKREEAEQLIQSAAFPGICFIQNESNTGFAKANNLVLQHLKNEGAYVWLLNPDMTVKEDTLAEMVSFMAKQPLQCVAGCAVKSYAGNQELLFYGGGKVNFLSATVKMIRDEKQVANIDYISGASLFTHADNFRTYGLLPESYFLYWEETDWCYKARMNGCRLAVCREAVCYDKVSTVIGRGFLSDYYYARNGLFFISRYGKKNIPVVVVLLLVRYLKRLVSGNFSRASGIKKGLVDFFKGKNGKVE